MNAYLTEMLDALVLPVAWALVHSLWQGVLITGGLASVLLAIRRRAATLRYGASLVALLLMLALPVATALRLGPASSQVLGRVAASATAVEEPAVGVAAVSSQRAAPLQARSWQLESALPWVFSIWLAGVLSLSLYHVGGWLLLRRLTHRATTPFSRHWQETAQRLARRLELTRPVRMLRSAAVQVPTVVGWLRPAILLPASALTGLTSEQLEAVLAHELAHVRRHDFLVNLVQTAVEIVLFYHPAAWWVSRQVRREREHCCDDVAVAVCGNAVSYARALSQLEGLRPPLPRVALAVTGTPLLDRVRRLLGREPAHRRPAGTWLAGAVIVSLLGAVALGTLATLAPQPAEAAASVGVYPEALTGTMALENGGGWSGSDAGPGAIAGTFRISRGWEDGLRLEMRSDGRHLRRTSMTLPEDQFTVVGEGAGRRLELRRDAGTFVFEGDIDQDLEGRGDFRFDPNPAYAAELDRLGFGLPTQEEVVALAIHDVSLDFARGLGELGYADIGLEQLLTFRIHDVDPEFVREMAAAGYTGLDDDELVAFRVHGVDPEFVREMAASGYTGIDAEQLVAFRVHGVDPEFVREMAAEGYTHLDDEQLVAFKVHGVDPRFVHEMKAAGHTHLDDEQLVAFKIHGVDPEFVREMAEAGYADLDEERLVAFKIHGVDPEFVREMAAAGHTHLDEEQLVAFRIHDVDPEFVRDMADAGYPDLDDEQLVAFKIHGVNPEFVRELAALGFDDLPATTLVAMKIHDVTPSFIRKLRAKGIDDVTARELIEMKIHNFDRFFKD